MANYTIITSAGLDLINEVHGSGAYFNLKYFILAYDYRIDGNVHLDGLTGIGFSADDITTVASASDVAPFGEIIKNVQGYTLSDHDRYILSADGVDLDGSVNPARVSNFVNSQAQLINLLNGTPLDNYITGDTIQAPGTNNYWSVTNADIVAGSSEVPTNTSEFFEVRRYTPRADQDGNKIASYLCVVDQQIGTFKFNKIGLYAIKLDSSFNEIGSPFLFAETILPEPQVKTDLGGIGSTNITVDVQIDLKTSPGDFEDIVFGTSGDYWAQESNGLSTYQNVSVTRTYANQDVSASKMFISTQEDINNDTLDESELPQLALQYINSSDQRRRLELRVDNSNDLIVKMGNSFDSIIPDQNEYYFLGKTGKTFLGANIKNITTDNIIANDSNTSNIGGNTPFNSVRADSTSTNRIDALTGEIITIDNDLVPNVINISAFDIGAAGTYGLRDSSDERFDYGYFAKLDASESVATSEIYLVNSYSGGFNRGILNIGANNPSGNFLNTAEIGKINFYGTHPESTYTHITATDTSRRTFGEIVVTVDGTPTAIDSTPGRMSFRTCDGVNGSAFERMSIDKDGNITIDESLTVLSGLNVFGNTSFNNDVTVFGNLGIGGGFFVPGSITAGLNKLEINSNVDIYDNKKIRKVIGFNKVDLGGRQKSDYTLSSLVTTSFSPRSSEEVINWSTSDISTALYLNYPAFSNRNSLIYYVHDGYILLRINFGIVRLDGGFFSDIGEIANSSEFTISLNSDSSFFNNIRFTDISFHSFPALFQTRETFYENSLLSTYGEVLINIYTGISNDNVMRILFNNVRAFSGATEKFLDVYVDGYMAIPYEVV